MMRAPLQPIGWPSAQAPPLTLTMLWEIPSSFIAAIGTTAKASLISHRSTSMTCQPSFFSSLFTAPTGAVENHSGAWAKVAWPRMRAIGAAPRSWAVDSRLSTSAAAPSLIDELDAAVMVPSFLKAGLSDAIFSSLTLPGVSSLLMTVSPVRPLTVTGVISALKAPDSPACLARCTLRVAKASCASRVKPYLAAQSSPKVPMDRPASYASSRPSSIMWSITRSWPMRMPPLAFGSRYGALVMLSMPPATITSRLPATSWSCASRVASMPEPHIFDSVTAPVAAGRPPLNPAWRAGACPWPAIRQLPNSTSSTFSGAMPERSTAARMAAPPRSLADRLVKSPWKAPIGVRAAPRMTMESSIFFPLKLGWKIGWTPYSANRQAPADGQAQTVFVVHTGTRRTHGRPGCAPGGFARRRRQAGRHGAS